MPNTSLAPRYVYWREQQELILIRGVPGTGKSTLANRILERYIPNAHHWEADMFFETEHGYVYNPALIPDAHAWCKSQTYRSLKDGFNPVIVSNTFTQMWQMVPYFNMCRELGLKLRIIELFKEYGSIHGVPEETMKRMREKWEPLDVRRLVGITYYILTVNEGDLYDDTT